MTNTEVENRYPIELKCDKVQLWPDGIMVCNGREHVVSCAGFPLRFAELTDADIEWACKKAEELGMR